MTCLLELDASTNAEIMTNVTGLSKRGGPYGRKSPWDLRTQLTYRRRRQGRLEVTGPRDCLRPATTHLRALWQSFGGSSSMMVCKYMPDVAHWAASATM